MDEGDKVPDAGPPRITDGEGDRGTTLNGNLSGCLAAISFALIAGFVVLVGTTMGDCAPDQHCHAHDGALLLRELGIVSAAALALGWLMRTAMAFLFWRLPPAKDSVGAGCLAAGVAILVGAVAGGYWIEVMLAFGL